MVSLTIDGKTVSVARGTTILEAARQLGITIPTLCWLQKVSPTGACRICAVEVEGVDRTMTACNTVVKDGIVVTTQSERLFTIRKQIVELLLVNHPLDCPVCDAGGECELQDITYAFGVNRPSFAAENVNPDTIDGWPLIQQVPSRCVLCEKCVKVCHETVGAQALLVNDRGDRAFIDKRLENCEYCGNCVQVCPTGTMISKTFKFKARPWELQKTASICTLCPSQCEVDVHTKQNQVCRVTSEDGETVNNGSLCIGGFFAHGFLNSEKRLTSPLKKRVDGQQPLDWDEALSSVVEKAATAGGEACAGLTGGRLGNEEYYLFQKLFRAGFGSNNIDSEARFGYLRGIEVLQSALGLGGASHLPDRIGQVDAVVVVGADPTSEAPLVDWQIQQACRVGDGKLILANQRKVKLNQYANTPMVYRPGSEVALVNALTKLVLEQDGADDDFLGRYLGNVDELKSFYAAVDLGQAIEATGVSAKTLQDAAGYLVKAESVAVVFGGEVLRGPMSAEATRALVNLALVCGALHGDIGGLFPLDEKGNLAGAIDAGVAPGLLPGQQAYGQAGGQFASSWGVDLPQQGKDANQILHGIEAGEIRFLYLAGVNPLLAFPQAARWRKALEKVEFLVVQDILASELTSMADIVLPGAGNFEKSGSVTGLGGRVGYLKPAVSPVGESRPDFEIFAGLLAKVQRDSAPASLAAVQTEMKDLSGLYEDVCFTASGRRFCYRKGWKPVDGSLRFAPAEGVAQLPELVLLTGASMFQFGSTTTFSPGTATVAPTGQFLVNPADALSCGVNDGALIKVSAAGEEIQGAIKLSDDVPRGVLFAPANFADLPVRQLIPEGNLVGVSIAKA